LDGVIERPVAPGHAGTAPAGLTVPINPTGLSPGTYSGVIAITAAGGSNNPQDVLVNLAVTAAASTVVITSIVNSASGATGSIAPGEIITIKGSGLGPPNGVSFSVDPSTGMVGTTLSGTQVSSGSFAAPVTYSSAGQINAIVPYEVAGQSTIVLKVKYQGTISSARTLNVANGVPGAFTINGTGAGQAVASNEDGSLNSSANPAAQGSYVTVYFTGGGQTTPPGVTGSVTDTGLKWLTQSISVTVGGVLATVAFDGAAPFLVDGVGQLNIRLANNTPSGAQPMIITSGSVSSPPTASLSIK
jgi:trimeric autotransporter adhesin